MWPQETTREYAPDTEKWLKVFSIVQVPFCEFSFVRGVYLVDGDLYSKGKQGIPGDKPRGVPVEDGNGTPQLLSHNYYWLSQHPQFVIGGTEERYCLPPSQYAPTADGNEGGGPVQDLLDLQKAYDDLYSERSLKILAGCGVSPWAICILQTYWVRITMVSKIRGYHTPPFKGFYGVTQGDPLSPTVFNVIMGTVMCH